MFIEPLQCSSCGRKGRPGEEGFQSSTDGGEVFVHCECKHKFAVESSRDQQILSGNEFVRLGAASNYSEWGTLAVVPGMATEVKFSRRFDFPCKVYFTPEGSPIMAKEVFLQGDQMTVVSSMWPGRSLTSEPVKVTWLIYGLIDIEALPTWYIHFYSAITQVSNGLYKTGLFDYAVSFETFVESFLAERLGQRYGSELSEYLLRRTWRIEDRCKELLQLAVGRRLTERDDVYQPWERYVHDIRNRLAHGERIAVDRLTAERAHDAVYQAIRWIESVAP
jgi:hypothetical protein